MLSTQDNIEEEIHIFGTGSMAHRIKDIYHFQINSIDDINQRTFPLFHSAKTEIYLQSKLREEIMTGNYKHQQYLLNRLTSIVRTFYICAEFKVDQISVDFHDSRKNEVIQLINYLLTEDLVKEYHFKQDKLSKEEISFILCEHTQLQIIYLYEIEYLNFFRMTFIHWLKNKGFTIEFRVPYNKQYPHTFSYWQKVYQVASRQNLNNCDSLVHEHNMKGNRFALFNENTPEREMIRDRQDIQIMEFSSPADFYHYQKRSRDNIIAVRPNEINRIINHNMSHLYENSTGKFLYYLQFCKKENDMIFATYDVIVELITSAWVKTNQVFGLDALSYLIDLRNYMYGVKTISDVRDRLERLQELEFVSKTFDRENAKDFGKNYMKRYMLNPFRTFSFLHQERYDVTIHQLIELVDQLEKICKSILLEEYETLQVNDYFERWEKFLEEVDESEQKTIWKKIFQEKLPEQWEFAIQELFTLIFLLASSQVNGKTEVYDISRLQEYIIQNNTDKRLHITNLTQLNFPERHKTPLSDFFSHSELKELARITNGFIQPILLHALWVDYMVFQNFEDLGIYQIYNTLAHYPGPVTFSWIHHIHEDDMRSVYLDILSDLYTDIIMEYKPTDSIGVSIKKIEGNSPITINVDVDRLKGKIPDLYWLNHDFCSKKFFLTTILEMQPIYESEFHQQFVFSKIGKILGYSNEEREEFRKLIYPLFPQWTYSKKENLIDVEYKIKLRNYKEFENISYPKALKGIHILRSMYRENRRTKARNYYRKKSSNHEKDLLKQFRENITRYKVKAEPGNHCKMCPHLNSCREGVYAIDNIIR